eukprot:scaffold14603_cov140-Isochrysis_galbana.AAC.2
MSLRGSHPTPAGRRSGDAAAPAAPTPAGERGRGGMLHVSPRAQPSRRCHLLRRRQGVLGRVAIVDPPRAAEFLFLQEQEKGVVAKGRGGGGVLTMPVCQSPATIISHRTSCSLFSRTPPRAGPGTVHVHVHPLHLCCGHARTGSRPMWTVTRAAP